MRKFYLLSIILSFMPIYAYAAGPFNLPFYEAHSINAYMDLDDRFDWVSDYAHPTPWQESVDPWAPGEAYDGHMGTDYSLSVGTFVAAAAPGTVSTTTDNIPNVWSNCSAYSPTIQAGNKTIIDHGVDYVTEYFHLQDGSHQVFAPNSVSLGQYIANSGNTGCSSGPHLHFEVVASTSLPVDPYSQYLWSTSPATFAPLPTTTVSGTISGSVTWSAPMVYIISGSVTISSGAKLTIEPGVVVKFLDTTSNLLVDGELDIEGSINKPVYMTSIKDDSVGGDSGGDGNSTSPAGGDWDAIVIDSNASTTINYGIIRYGGAIYCCTYYSGSTIVNNGGLVTMNNSVLASTTAIGVYNLNGTSTVSNSEMHGNGTALDLVNGYISLSTSTINVAADGVASYYGFLTQSGVMKVTNSVFNLSGTTALVGFASAFTDFIHSNNTAFGTGRRAYQVYGVLKDTTWQADNIPYFISGWVDVAANTTLTLDPGVVIKFDSAAALTVEGMLSAVGNSSNKIYFTSLKDDDVGGDTDGDGATTNPSIGDWDQLQFNSGTSTLSHVIVRYGSTGVHNQGGAVEITNSELASSSSYGIFQDAGVTDIASSSINHNSSYGVYNNTSSVINAQNNYWGASSGPYHTTLNPSGGGDQVSDYVDFSSWLTSAP